MRLIPAFGRLGSDVLEELAAATRLRRFSAGSVLVLGGDEPALIAVIDGATAVGLATSPADLGPADVHIAPAAIFTGVSLIQGRSVMSVTAKNDVVALHWTQTTLLSVMARHPELSQALAGILGDLALRAMTSTADNQIASAERRCAATLHRLSSTGCLLPMTRHEIGHLSRVARNLTGSILCAFSSVKLLALGYGQIRINDRAALALIREGEFSVHDGKCMAG